MGPTGVKTFASCTDHGHYLQGEGGILMMMMMMMLRIKDDMRERNQSKHSASLNCVKNLFSEGSRLKLLYLNMMKRRMTALTLSCFFKYTYQV